MPFDNPFVFVIVIFVVVLLGRAVVFVPENKRGAVVRIGAYLKTLNPGFHIRVPFIDLVTKVDLDANIPGWQALSESQLEAAVKHYVTVGSVTGEMFGGSRAALPSKPASGTREANALAEWLVKAASDQIGVDLSNDTMARGRIAERAQSAVEEIRASGSCEIHLPFLTADQTGPKHFSLSLKRSQVEGILGPARG